MAQPVPYDPSHAFVGDAAANSWFPGQQLDIEFVNIEETTDEVLANLKKIQRDDGALRNGVVTFDSLTLSDGNPLAYWVVNHQYQANEVVIFGSGIYACKRAHSSSNFTTDLNSGVWLLLFQVANSSGTALEFVFDGGGVAISTGVKGTLEVPFDCTIVRSTLMADQVGSCQIDLLKSNAATFAPPSYGSSIVAAAPPTLVGASFVQDSTLTGWTTSLSAGDILAFSVTSAATITRLTLSLKVLRPLGAA